MENKKILSAFLIAKKKKKKSKCLLVDEWINKIWSIHTMAPIQSSVLAWRIPWTEEPYRLQFMGPQRVGHNWVTRQYNGASFSSRNTDTHYIMGEPQTYAKWKIPDTNGHILYDSHLYETSKIFTSTETGSWWGAARSFGKEKTLEESLGLQGDPTSPS